MCKIVKHCSDIVTIYTLALNMTIIATRAALQKQAALIAHTSYDTLYFKNNLN